MGLAQMLAVRPGVTAVIGGGGKTTLLRALGGELAERHSVLLCTTTKMFPFPDLPLAKTLAELDELRRPCCVLCAGTLSPDTGKLTVLPVSMAALAERFEYVLVEADGSAQRPLKAHSPREPVIPSEAEQTICVVGAAGFGKPISQAAHRPALYAYLAGVDETAAATPERAAAVLNAEGLHHRVYVNQVETPADLAAARRLAARLDCPVLAGSLWRGAYHSCSL